MKVSRTSCGVSNSSSAGSESESDIFFPEKVFEAGVNGKFLEKEQNGIVIFQDLFLVLILTEVVV